MDKHGVFKSIFWGLDIDLLSMYPLCIHPIRIEHRHPSLLLHGNLHCFLLHHLKIIHSEPKARFLRYDSLVQYILYLNSRLY